MKTLVIIFAAFCFASVGIEEFEHTKLSGAVANVEIRRDRRAKR